KRGWLRANGIPQSDQATVLEHFMRHGDRITYFSLTTDPVYLAEPWSRTSFLVRNARDPGSWLYACDDGEEILGRKDDDIPNYLFGENPYVKEYSEKHKVPLLAALGGPETMHPEIL